MAEFPALPLWTDAYLGDTTHLTTIEHGAYLLLLFTAWRTPTYDLPNDDRLLARFCRLTDGQWQRIKPTVMAYWRLKNGRWSNGRLLDERDAVRRKVAQRSDAGKASALKRLNRSPTADEREANETSTSKATATAISISSKELIAKPKKSRREMPPDFPLESDREWALQLWLQKGRADLAQSLGDESAKFRDHHSAKLTAFADWPAAWRTWARNAIKFNTGGYDGRSTRQSNHERAFDVAKELAADLAAGRWQPGESGETSGSRSATITLLPTRPKP